MSSIFISRQPPFYPGVEEIKRDIHIKCLSIRTIISSNTNFKLSDLQPFISKYMAWELDYHHCRSLGKLRNPEKFSITELHRFANYTESDVERLTRIVNNELKAYKTIVPTLNKFRSVDRLPAYMKAEQKAK